MSDDNVVPLRPLATGGRVPAGTPMPELGGCVYPPRVIAGLPVDPEAALPGWKAAADQLWLLPEPEEPSWRSMFDGADDDNPIRVYDAEGTVIAVVVGPEEQHVDDDGGLFYSSPVLPVPRLSWHDGSDQA